MATLRNNLKKHVGIPQVQPTKKIPTRSTSRSALGDIGNKNKVVIKPKEEKPTVKKNIDHRNSQVDLKQISKISVEDCPDERVVEVLPEGVPDIDLKDQDNPQLCAEYASSLYAYLRNVEKGLVIQKDFLKGCSVNGKMRAVLIDWLIEVHSQFKLLQETLFMAVYLIDKYLQVDGLLIRRNKLQLVGVTAMFIASKVEEMYAPEINDFVYITDQAYTAAEIRQMELRMLRAIDFNFSRPLALHFLRRNSKAGDVDVMQHTVAKYLLEMALVEYDLAHYPPSMMAAAALLLSLVISETDSTLSSAWIPTLQYYSTYKHTQLLPIVTKLAQIVLVTKESQLQAVHTKYMGRKFFKVGEYSELRGNKVQKLARKDYGNV